MPGQKGTRGSGTTVRRGRAGNQTPDTPEINESDLGRLKVAELRERLAERGVTGVSGLRKQELVKTLVKALRQDHPKGGTAKKRAGGGIREGTASSRSLKYAQEVTSTSDEPERPGRSLVTTDHEVIRQWAEQRDAVPATVAGTEYGDRPGVLRFDFPGGSGGDRLRQVSWEDWFATFDERRLNFIYQQERTDGRQSNFFRLENPDREDA